MIELYQVNKVYETASHKVHALRDVSLNIPEGAVVAVTGRSGSGKSTLLHVVGCLESPSSGRVEVQGRDISHLNDDLASEYRNHCVGFIFQMNNLLPEFTAAENVMMPGLIAGINRSELIARSSSLLASVGLGDRMEHRPSELSGGEQQRVAIARALLMGPQVLLADEPTGNLDSKTSETVHELLVQVCEEMAVTMLLVTHDGELARRLPCELVMEDGQIVEKRGSW